MKPLFGPLKGTGKPKRVLILCLFFFFSFFTMACFSQTYLLDVSELSGPTRGSFPTGIVCVYKFKEFHCASLFSRVALMVSSLLRQGKGFALFLDYLWWDWFRGRRPSVPVRLLTPLPLRQPTLLPPLDFAQSLPLYFLLSRSYPFLSLYPFLGSLFLALPALTFSGLLYLI